jgi:hypothetical protein
MTGSDRLDGARENACIEKHCLPARIIELPNEMEADRNQYDGNGNPRDR